MHEREGKAKMGEEWKRVKSGKDGKNEEEAAC